MGRHETAKLKALLETLTDLARTDKQAARTVEIVSTRYLWWSRLPTFAELQDAWMAAGEEIETPHGRYAGTVSVKSSAANAKKAVMSPRFAHL